MWTYLVWEIRDPRVIRSSKVNQAKNNFDASHIGWYGDE